MSQPKSKRPVKNAGAFMGADPFGMIAVPSMTLSDEYRDVPAEPQDSDRVPDPEPVGVVRRAVDRLTGHSKP